MTHSKADLDHFVAYRLRLRDFINLSLVWEALRDPRTTTPSLPPPIAPAQFADTVRLATIGWFASLVDPTGDSVNFFNMARQFFPHLKNEIRAVEKAVKPQIKKVLDFRNVVAFHANKSLSVQKKAREAVKDKAVTQATIRVLDLAHKLLDEELKDPELKARLVAEGLVLP